MKIINKANVDMEKDIKKAKELKEEFFNLSEEERVERVERYVHLLAGEYIYFNGLEYYKGFEFEDLDTVDETLKLFFRLKMYLSRVIKDRDTEKMSYGLKSLFNKYSKKEIEEAYQELEEMNLNNQVKDNELVEDYLKVVMGQNIQVVCREALSFATNSINEPIYGFVLEPIMKVYLECETFFDKSELTMQTAIFYNEGKLTLPLFIFYSVAYVMRNKSLQN